MRSDPIQIFYSVDGFAWDISSSFFSFFKLLTDDVKKVEIDTSLHPNKQLLDLTFSWISFPFFNVLLNVCNNESCLIYSLTAETPSMFVCFFLLDSNNKFRNHNRSAPLFLAFFQDSNSFQHRTGNMSFLKCSSLLKLIFKILFLFPFSQHHKQIITVSVYQCERLCDEQINMKTAWGTVQSALSCAGWVFRPTIKRSGGCWEPNVDMEQMYGEQPERSCQNLWTRNK